MPDFMPHHRGIGERLGHLGKKLAPILSRILHQPPVGHYFRYMSMYLEMLQGKGAGAGWDVRNEVRIAKRFIRRESPIIFDVGAHTGTWSHAILDSLSDDCHLYQFEPAKENIAILRQMQLTHTNVTLIEKAVSDTKGEALLYVADSASDTSSLHVRRESIFELHQYQPQHVEATTIDDVVKEFEIETVDFMKMDIEGHEIYALQGAAESLAQRKIRTLTFEFGSGNINSRTFFHDFWELLHPLGYSISRICPGGVLLPIDRYYEDLEYFRNVTNYLATLERSAPKLD